jgi:outer membrane protein
MKYTGHIALVLSVALAAYIFADRYQWKSAGKIGVVQMERLVYEYKGMKEATQVYTQKVAGWGSQTDSLQKSLKLMYQKLRLDSLRDDRRKLGKDLQIFEAARLSYLEHVEQVQEAAASEDRHMTLGVVNQINQYIRSFAQEEGYDVVLCNNQQQSVGHAGKTIDITDRVLEFANRKYEGLK